MQNPVVYNYQCPRQFLLDYLGYRQRLNPGFSMRAWAKQMGLKSHSLLVMLLQNKRPLRMKHLLFLSKGLKLSSQEQLYLQALIQFESATTPEQKKLCSVWLSELNPGHDFRAKEVDEFIMISHWVHMAILSMSELGDFTLTEKNIEKRLRGKVTSIEIKAAVSRLLQLGLLHRAADGVLTPTYNKVTTKNDVASAGARAYHKQVMELAAKAIEEVAMERREFQSFAIAIAESKIPLAKEMIRKFRRDFAKAMGPEAGDEVFQFNIQFFQLTESPSSEKVDQ